MEVVHTHMSQHDLIGPPRGFRDILPTEARELGVIERSLAAVFAAYGFTSLHPPLLEYGRRSVTPPHQFSTRGAPGLRPDLTTSVARLVAAAPDAAGVPGSPTSPRCFARSPR